MQNQIKNDLQNLFSGKSEVRHGTIIRTIANYLEKSEKASTTIKEIKLIKKQEAEKLEFFITQNKLWKDVDFDQYVSEGAEQKVYLKDSNNVLKLNDAIYFASWKDYFYNLLLHNYFFTDTAYNLIGFTKQNQSLYAMVEQSFV